MSSTISNLVSPIQQQSSPAAFAFHSPVTPQTWTQLAEATQNDDNTPSEYEMELNDQTTHKSS